jgi:hypothetical protein
MYDEVSKNHIVFRTAAGEVILEFDSWLTPPQAGTITYLPAFSNAEVFVPYRVTEVVFAPQDQVNIMIYIEVEPT